MNQPMLPFLALATFLIIAVSIYMKGIYSVAKIVLIIAAILMLFISALRMIVIIIAVIIAAAAIFTSRYYF